MGSILKGKILDTAIMNGVSVVTSSSQNKRAGCTVSWFAQVSFSPVLIMISLSSARHTYSLITKSNIFNVNVLSDTQLDIARHFGLISGRTTDKFEKITCILGKNNAPVLPEVKALFECRVVHTYQAGDHDLFIGEVTSFTEDAAKKPLLFRGADYW